ncbi:MAG: MMPL family transporter [Planctomycetaceae bacterium]|nr:MMPL family transporter [Planctomycetaceae bacterium]
MFFERLGRSVARYWLPVLLAWMATVIVAASLAPGLDDVVETGEFSFLPTDSPSREAEKLLAKAFPKNLLSSSVVIVARRTSRAEGLNDADWDFVDDGKDWTPGEKPRDLVDHVLQIANEEGGLAESIDSHVAGNRSIIAEVRSFRDRTIGNLLTSEDGQATLVLIGLTTEFMDARNGETIARLEAVLGSRDIRYSMPPGLDLTLSGAAVVGRDMLVAQRRSAQATESLTVVLVVILLIAIYRAPLLAFIPLLTVFVSVLLTMSLLKIGAQWGWVVLFSGIESYVTVLLYGAGVDYCLFLIARYKEEVDVGQSLEDSSIGAVGKVGDAIAASAGTVICGIGMMIFAEFGKFHDAGIAIAFGLVIVLIASLTFTPALLRASGKWVFWPHLPQERIGGDAGWLPAASWSNQLLDWLRSIDLWDWMGKQLLRRPGFIWSLAVLLMVPFAVVGVIFYTHLSYGLLSDLPSSAPSVTGTRAVRDHFPEGATGPVVVLLEDQTTNFGISGENGAYDVARDISAALYERRKELQLADVRSAAFPFGGPEDVDESTSGAQRRILRKAAIDHYVSRVEPHNGTVTRLDLTTEVDPFSRDSIDHLNRLQEEIQKTIPERHKATMTVRIAGPTASIRDLKAVTDRDQIRINLLVIAGVYVILVVLLRRPAISAYLIVSVLFSFLVTLGLTYTVFWALDPQEFAGLDWKVPMFLFTILIAVGEDYNIFLMTRIHEEQVRLGPVNGIIHALSRTGRIISSCGIIMAGTFASLMAGELRGMTQLGFALASGVLIDTFVIRPIVVPAYLVMLNQGRFGPLGPWLGAEPASTESTPDSPPIAGDSQA